MINKLLFVNTQPQFKAEIGDFYDWKFSTIELHKKSEKIFSNLFRV